MNKIKKATKVLFDNLFMLLAIVFLVLLIVNVLTICDTNNLIIQYIGLFSCLILHGIDNVKRKIDKLIDIKELEQLDIDELK